MDTLKDIGEFGLIERIKANFASKTNIGIGDDCAVIPIGSEFLLVTVDTMIENVHFFSDQPLFNLGRKALSINVSDIVACGGKPLWAFLSLSVNPSMRLQLLDEFLAGLKKSCQEYNIELLGGNTTKDDKLSINITLIGKTNKPILRSTAKQNQNVYVTGTIGSAACGFFAVKNKVSSDYIEDFISPKARLDLVDKLTPYVSAMIDVSDGLLQDAMHICQSSNVGMDLYLEKIPLCSDDNLSDIEKISFGEDYQLLFCADKMYEMNLDRIAQITLIGYTNDKKNFTLYKNGVVLPINNYGFKHF